MNASPFAKSPKKFGNKYLQCSKNDYYNNYKVNMDLYSLCTEYGLDFINNENIEDDCLGAKRFHLNKKGNSCLAVNFMRFEELLFARPFL